jgi:hypothetical protein
MEYKYVYVGIMEEYSEQGSGSSLHIHDDRGLHPNTGYPDNKGPEHYRSLDWTTTYRSGQHLTVMDSSNDIVFEGVIHNDRIKARTNMIQFAPKDVDIETWLHWHYNEYRGILKSHTPTLLQDSLKVMDMRWVFAKLLSNYKHL